jgi:TonB family protein
MSRKTAALVLLHVCALIALGAAGAPQKELPLRRSPSAENPVMVLTPFDTERALPGFYAGNVIELSYLMFSEPRRKDTPPAGFYAYVLPDAVFTYDADAGRLQMHLPSRTVHRAGSSEVLTPLRAASTMPAGSSMAGMNGCARDGAPPTYNIVVLDQPLKTTLSVPMPREKAEEAIPHLRALVAIWLDANAGHVLRLSSEDEGGRSYVMRPLREVRELVNCELALGGTLESIRVYDFRTGEVHARFTLPEAAAAPADPARERPLAMKLAPARYPEAGRRRRIRRDAITAEVTVAADGTVKDVKILPSQSLPPGFDDAVRKAIEASSFEPAVRNGVPVEARTVVTYTFDPETGQGVPGQ